jgi:hypothetical protein
MDEKVGDAFLSSEYETICYSHKPLESRRTEHNVTYMLTSRTILLIETQFSPRPEVRR